jgi:hypothetical protein
MRPTRTQSEVSLFKTDHSENQEGHWYGNGPVTQNGSRLLVSYLIQNPKTIWLKVNKCRVLSSPPPPKRLCGIGAYKTSARPRWGLCFTGACIRCPRQHHAGCGRDFTLQAAESSPYGVGCVGGCRISWGGCRNCWTRPRSDCVDRLRSSLSIPPLTRRQHRCISSFDDPATPRPYLSSRRRPRQAFGPAPSR